MELVDLVIQGLNGAPELQRIVFGPATIVPITNAREKNAARIVLELLYPRALQDSEPALADLDDKSGNSRVALTVLARDGARWRLLMDLSNGRRALQKLPADGAAGKAPEMVSTSPAEIAQVVTAQLGFPQEDVARELLFCQREALPSRRAKRGGGVADVSGSFPVQRPSVEKPLPPGFGDTNPGVSKPLPPGFGDGGGSGVGASVYASWSEADLRKRLDEIDTVLNAQKGTKDVEFELDGLQKKNFELEARLKPLLTLRRSVEQAVEQVRKYSAVDRVPSDLVEKGERLKRIRVEHQGELGRLADEKDSLVRSVASDERAMHQSPLAVAQKDPLVLYGVAGGLGALLVGFAGGAAMESLRWLALLDIPAFGVAVFGAIRVLSSLEDREVVRRRTKRLDEDRRRAIERFKIDEEQIQALLEKHGYQLEQLPELQGQLVARDDARRMLDQTRAALEEATKEGDVRELERQKEDLAPRIKALEEKLQLSSAGFGASAGDLQAERAEIDAALQALQSGSAPAAKASAPPAPAEPVADARASSSGLAPADDLCKRVLEVTRDVFMSTVEEVANQTAPRASQIALALTDGRYKEVRFGARGEASVVDAAADEVLPFTLLPASDRDLVYLSVRIAAIEAVAKRERFPVVFDRGLDGFPDAKGPLLKRMLQFLAGTAQVACFTEKGALR